MSIGGGFIVGYVPRYLSMNSFWNELRHDRCEEKHSLHTPSRQRRDTARHDNSMLEDLVRDRPGNNILDSGDGSMALHGSICDVSVGRPTKGQRWNLPPENAIRVRRRTRYRRRRR